MKLIKTQDYLLLIDEEAEIKEGDTMYDKHLVGLCTCTDIKNNLPISYMSSFLNAVKVIACYSITKEAKELDLPLLPNPFKTYRVGRKQKRVILDEKGVEIGIFKTGFEEQAQKYCDYLNSKKFTLEDVKKAFKAGVEFQSTFTHRDAPNLEEYIKSLSTQQLPKEFIPEYEKDITNGWSNVLQGGDGKSKFKIITNSEAKQELVGTYKY